LQLCTDEVIEYRCCLLRCMSIAPGPSDGLPQDG
jgi:hypothetical protein